MKAFALVLPILFVAGCGSGKKKGPATVEVSGRVTLNKRPLGNATVNFVTTDFAASAITDADGKYTLPQGAVPGENLVYITKSKKPGFDDPEEGMDAGQEEAMSGVLPGTVKASDSELPPQYSDPEKSILKYVIPDGGTDTANFNLTIK